MKTKNKKMMFSVSQTQTQWQFLKMEDLVEPTASILSHHYLISLQPVLLCHFFFFIFFSFTQSSLFSLTQCSPSLFCVALERKQDQRLEASPMIRDSRNDIGLSLGRIVRHADLEIGSFASLETRKPQDWTKPRSDLLLLSFSFLFSLLFLFFFKVGFCS